MAIPEPKVRADELIREAPSRRWLRALVDALDHEIRTDPLERLRASWQLSGSELGSIFGVTRQAVSKWREGGVPPERAEALADLAAANELLERKLKRERIPAVVRRRAPRLGDRSLLELAQEGRHGEVRDRVKEMFDLRRLQP